MTKRTPTKLPANVLAGPGFFAGIKVAQAVTVDQRWERARAINSGAVADLDTRRARVQRAHEAESLPRRSPEIVLNLMLMEALDGLRPGALADMLAKLRALEAHDEGDPSVAKARALVEKFSGALQ